MELHCWDPQRFQRFVQGRGQCRDNHWSYTVGTPTWVKRDLRTVLPAVNVPIQPGMDFTSTFCLCCKPPTQIRGISDDINLELGSTVLLYLYGCTSRETDLNSYRYQLFNKKGNLPKVKVLPLTNKAVFSYQDNTLTNSALLCTRFQ